MRRIGDGAYVPIDGVIQQHDGEFLGQRAPEDNSDGGLL